MALTGTEFNFRTIFKNGTMIEKTYTENPTDSSNEVSIGGTVVGSTADQSLSGIINRIWYYGGAISDSDLTSQYSFSSGRNLQHLIIHHRLNRSVRLLLHHEPQHEQY